MACKYKLNLNDEIFEFNSEEELNSFINNNYHRLSLNKGTLNIKFSKNFNVKEESIAKVKKAIQDSVGLTTEFNENGERVLHVANGYTGVTRKIDGMVVNGRRITKEFITENYVADQIPKEAAKMRLLPEYKDLSEIIILEKAEELIRQNLKNWSMLGPMGTDIHAMAEAYFNEGVTSPEAMLERIQKPFTLPTMVKYMAMLDEIKQRIIIDSGDPDVTIMSEVKIHDPNSKVAGILDIVAIDSKGHAHIYDLKTSYKKIEEWNTAKNNKILYQQAFYKQLLNTAGIIVSPNNGINIIPIELIDIDYENTLVSDIAIQNTSHLEPEYSAKPYIMQNVKQVIPTSVNSVLNIEVQSEKVKKELKEAFGYEVKAGYIYGKRNFIDKNVHTDDNGNKYFDDSRKNRIYLTGDADKDDVTITEYLKEQVEAKNTDLNILKSSIQRVIRNQSDLILDLTGNFGSNSSLRKWQFAGKIFKPYVDGTWELIDSPDLDSLGILGFNNLLTGTLEFVSLTANALNTPIKLLKGTTVLGNYVDDRSVYKDTRLLKATGANIEALKIAIFLNDNAEAFMSANSDTNLGYIRAVNLNVQEVSGINNEDLIYSYKKLNIYTKTENKLNIVPKANPYNNLMARIDKIVNSDDTPRAVKTRMDNLKTRFNTGSDDSIIAQLYDAQRTFIVDQRKDLDSADSFGADEEQIFRLINQAINYYNKITIRFEKDMVDWGFQNSRATSSIDDVSNESVKAVNKLIKSSMGNIRYRYDDYKSDTRKEYEKLFNAKGFGTLRRYTIGDNIKAYDNLFVREKDGSISKEMKVKDPNNMTNNLSQAERDFLNMFLSKINAERYKYAELSEINQAKASGDWFNIPLVKASALSRFRNKDYKSIAKDYWDDILNFNNLFTEDEAEQEKKSNEMLEMTNHLALTPEARKIRIDNHNLGDFETDLEIVLDLFVMGSIRKEEFDQILPAVMAIKLETQYMNAGLLNKKLPNTIGYIDEFVKIAVYNEAIIDDNQKNFVKIAKTVTSTVSKANLGLNFLSGIREVLQGQWANSVRVFSRTYGENQFTRVDYGKALKYMLNDAPDFIKNVTTIESLNSIYGMANMDVNGMVERMAISDTGATAFFNKWTMWMTSAPDYLNRMSIFIAQMMHDGCFEAHSMVNDKLVYDWKKDKRFSAYANGQVNDPQYKAQKGLYITMMEEFILEGVRNKNGTVLNIGDPLPLAYTTRDRQSLKSFANSIHGHYDHEDKTKMQRTWFGLLFMQFKTWMIAKKEQWTREGGEYVQGKYVHKTDETGAKLYRHLDKNGNVEFNTDDSGTPLYEWKGNWQEGILVSLSKITSELKESKYDFKKAYALIKDDSVITSNLRLMAGDLAVFATLFALFGLVDWDALKEDSAFTYAISRAVLSSANDLFIGNNISSLANPKSFIPSIGYVSQVSDDLWGVMTGDKDMFKAVTRNIGLLRPLQYVQMD